jgi:hypothetical protein
MDKEYSLKRMSSPLVTGNRAYSAASASTFMLTVARRNSPTKKESRMEFKYSSTRDLMAAKSSTRMER